MSNKQPPPLARSLEAERAVLGAVLLDEGDGGDEELADRVLTACRRGDFHSNLYRHVFLAIRRVKSAGAIADLPAILDDLDAHGHLDQLGGSGVVIERLAHPTTAGFEHALARLHEASAKRDLRDVASDLERESGDGSRALDILDACEARIDEIRARLLGEEAGLVHACDVIGPSIVGYMPEPLSTSIPEFDVILGGGFRVGFNPVIGRPGRGKTTFVNQFIAGAAARGVPCLVVTLENSIAQQGAMMVSRICGVDSIEFGTGEFKDDPACSAAEKRQIVDDTYEHFRSSLNPHIVFTEECRLARLERLINGWARRHRDARHRVVLLDTAHNVSAPGETRSEQVSKVSEVCKRLQRTHSLIFFLTCHMNRAGDIRDSERIAHDADLTLRVEAFDPDDQSAEDRDLDSYCRAHKTIGIRLLVEKEKAGGQTGEYRLVFRKQFARFSAESFDAGRF